jgi:hypothetical protein
MKKILTSTLLVFTWYWMSLVTFPLQAEDVYMETSVKRSTPRKESKRSTEGGLEHVPFRIGFPQGVKTIQGVTFTFYTKAVTKEHWQAACRHGGFGILAANFFPAKNDEIPGQAVKSLLIERVEDMGNPIDILLENHRAMLRLKAQPVA